MEHKLDAMSSKFSEQKDSRWNWHPKQVHIVLKIFVEHMFACDLIFSYDLASWNIQLDALLSKLPNKKRADKTGSPFLWNSNMVWWAMRMFAVDNRRSCPIQCICKSKRFIICFVGLLGQAGSPVVVNGCASQPCNYMHLISYSYKLLLFVVIGPFLR